MKRYCFGLVLGFIVMPANISADSFVDELMSIKCKAAYDQMNVRDDLGMVIFHYIVGATATIAEKDQSVWGEFTYTATAMDISCTEDPTLTLGDFLRRLGTGEYNALLRKMRQIHSLD
ncbi:hypothetical protein [Pseudaestuariivita rosea]|uniref:hypothetical protein n=1 Tax=Pseudaestuariivita rosea TaxID=2763263 RepID=UPI001ABA6871|nr:hypothetical protein [Pseudaestuariivita rosea]